jgi:hypothetical protein
MTDATSPANGNISNSQSALAASPDDQDTSGYGDQAEAQTPAAPDSGAGAWRGQPGAANPAGWFPSASGEAAPPQAPDTEPARTDVGYPANPRSDSLGSGVLPGPDFFLMCHPGPGFGSASRPRSGERATQPPGPEAWLPEPGQESPREQPSQEPAQSPFHSAESPPQAPRTAAPGSSAAVRGRAGGPGFEVPPETAQRHSGSAPGSVWQTAHEVWQDSGVVWEPSPPDYQEAPWNEYSPNAFAAFPELADDPGQPPLASPSPPLPPPSEPGGPAGLPDHPAAPPGPVTPPPPFGLSLFTRDEPAATSEQSAFPPPPPAQPDFASVPLSDLFAGPPARQSTEAPPGRGWSRPTRPPDEDDLFGAWQGSVRRGSGGPPKVSRRRKVLRAVGAAVVVVAVGFGAVILLTGKHSGAPAASTKHSALASATHSRSHKSTRHRPAAKHAPASRPKTVFAGYRGLRGTVTVTSMASGHGTRLAVGSADGHPAIWRRVGAAWILDASPAVYRRPGVEGLTSIAYGPAGWIAVGGALSGAAQQPVVVTSANGVTWRAIDSQAVFAGRDNYVTGVTVAQAGYVVVGRHVVGHRAFAAMWWSANLRNWVKGNNGGLNGRIDPSGVYAVIVVPGEFVAVGTHGDSASTWTSANGRGWQVHDIRRPAGASSAKLGVVAESGSRIVAAGYAVTKAGRIPIVVVSADGGKQWHQVTLAAHGRLGTVTALTAVGGGFVAAGRAGPAHAQQTVTWSSPNGTDWSAAASAGLGSWEITVLMRAGNEVTGVAQQGSTPSIVTLHAR